MKDAQRKAMWAKANNSSNSKSSLPRPVGRGKFKVTQKSKYSTILKDGNKTGDRKITLVQDNKGKYPYTVFADVQDLPNDTVAIRSFQTRQQALRYIENIKNPNDPIWKNRVRS